jgi:hypothetical protein
MIFRKVMSQTNKFVNTIMSVFVITSVILHSFNVYAASDKEIDKRSERCAKRTAEIFSKDYPTPTWKMPDGTTWSIKYEKHYNSKIDKCFMLIKTILIGSEREFVYNSYLLFNVDENKEYGEFLDFRKAEVTCYLLNKTCNSHSEWDELVKPYMTE